MKMDYTNWSDQELKLWEKALENHQVEIYANTNWVTKLPNLDKIAAELNIEMEKVRKAMATRGTEN